MIRSSRRTFIERLIAALGLAALPDPLRARALLPGVPGGGAGEDFWEEVRAAFLIPPDEAFFNTGSLGAQPRVVAEAVAADVLRVARDIAQWNYQPGGPRYQSGYSPELELRGKVAALINADAHDVALTVNSTMGMNFIAQGLELEAGDEVVLMEGAHPGGRAGWELRAKRDGIRVVRVQPPQPPQQPSDLLDLYVRATTPSTRVWAMPHISSAAGAILFPVEQMCRHARSLGIISVVDGAQSLGQRVVDVRAMECTAFFASGHKWLLSPVGCGVLYIRPDMQSRFWTTLAGVEWDNHEDGMYRFMQYGALSGSLLAGLEAAIDFHNAIGAKRIEERVISLTRRLREGLASIPGVRIDSPLHPDMITGMTTWGIGDMPGFELQEALWSRARVRVRAAGGGGAAVRQSCHICTLAADVDRSIRAARDIAHRSG
jgi:isopenicillin-N epimerase